MLLQSSTMQTDITSPNLFLSPHVKKQKQNKTGFAEAVHTASDLNKTKIMIEPD